ncbi:MAG: hypothetical protein NTW05_02905 [Pseudonocardiales bacterium]|nr:hypothetical protein [Pseudonocardiales bacterium]
MAGEVVEVFSGEERADGDLALVVGALTVPPAPGATAVLVAADSTERAATVVATGPQGLLVLRPDPPA